MQQDDIRALIQEHNRREQTGAEGAFGSWMGMNCEIHPNDDIFRFIYNGPRSKNPWRDYLADGWRTMVELMVPLEQLNHPLTRTRSFLEFACGYGRFTRHLARFIDHNVIHAADLMPGSAEFVTEKFGVNGFYSTADPDELQLGTAFDTVFVLSLFSHLPPHTWHRWLHRLFESVEPGGMLIFTTHGTGFAQRHGVELDKDGFFFHAASESEHLDGEQYGTTITSTEYVQRALRQLKGGELARFVPDHFWSGQDAWFVRKRRGFSTFLKGMR